MHDWLIQLPFSWILLWGLDAELQGYRSALRSFSFIFKSGVSKSWWISKPYLHAAEITRIYFSHKHFMLFQALKRLHVLPFSHGNIHHFKDHLIWITVVGTWSNLFRIQIVPCFCFSLWRASRLPSVIISREWIMFSALPDPRDQPGCKQVLSQSSRLSEWMWMSVCIIYAASLMGTEGLRISLHCKWFQTFEGSIVNIWFEYMSWLKGQCCIACIGFSALVLYYYYCFISLKQFKKYTMHCTVLCKLKTGMHSILVTLSVLANRSV